MSLLRILALRVFYALVPLLSTGMGALMCCAGARGDARRNCLPTPNVVVSGCR